MTCLLYEELNICILLAIELVRIEDEETLAISKWKNEESF